MTSNYSLGVYGRYADKSLGRKAPSEGDIKDGIDSAAQKAKEATSEAAKKAEQASRDVKSKL